MSDYLREVTLPSSGAFYNGQIPGGLVVVEPMGTLEEKLFSAGSSASAVINKIFTACCALPISPLDLVLGDRLFLLLTIRSVSYGDDYVVTFKCEECREKSWSHLNISEIAIRRVKEDATDSFSIKLPIIKKELEVRLLTGKDEQSVESYAKQLKAKVKGNIGNVEYIYRLARRIRFVDGESISINEAISVVETIKGQDSLDLRDEIDAHDVGPLLDDVTLECVHCSYPNETGMPFQAEFFRPRRRRSIPRENIGGTVAP